MMARGSGGTVSPPWWSLRGRWHDSTHAPYGGRHRALVTGARMHPVLVTGATARVGRLVVDKLLGAGVPVRALTRRPAAAGLPAAREAVAGGRPGAASLAAQPPG